jgi:hypothetical protein
MGCGFKSPLDTPMKGVVVKKTDKLEAVLPVHANVTRN